MPCVSMRPAQPTSPTSARIAATRCCGRSARARGRPRSRSPGHGSGPGCLPGRPGAAGWGGEWRQLSGPLLATAAGGRLRQGHLWELVRRLACTAGVARSPPPCSKTVPIPRTRPRSPLIRPRRRTRHDPADHPEISRLLAARLLRPYPPGHATHWLNWRRRHRARTRRYRQRARLARDSGITLVS
jgi:hypothetical protein